MGKKKNELHHLHWHRALWLATTVVGLFAIQTVAYVQRPQTAPHNVLAYSTSISVSELGAKTNAARTKNGLPPLAVHTLLNNGALAKAQHMVTHNYWAHTAPDGTEPWYFFAQSGYNYQHAGENLAYGFDHSAEIIDAWMNSPGHRANMLGDYKDVGFGFVNGSDYQGGQYTVVVAFYGRQPEVPAPTPAPTTPPAVQSTPAPAQSASPSTDPIPSSAEPTATPTSEPVEEKPAEQPAPSTAQQTEATAPPQRVTTLQSLINGSASWALYASLGLIGVTSVGFITTHQKLVRRGWKYSAHFILLHPALDTALLAGLIAALLSTTIGFIR